jgi:hypothetical protein
VADEDDIHGFLPPKPPQGGTPAPVPPAPRERPAQFDPLDLHRGSGPTRPRRTPLGMLAVVLGSMSLVLLVLSLGVAFPFASVLALSGLLVGRRAGHKVAVVLGWVGIVCALVAAIAWAGLDSAGFSPEELPKWLEDRREQIENAR